MMSQLFTEVETSFEELAFNVWPNLLSGRRVDQFTCFVTPHPDVPYTMLNFVTSPNTVFRDFGIVRTFQQSLADMTSQFYRFHNVEELKKTISRFKRRLTAMGEPCKKSGFSSNMCAPFFNGTEFYVGPFYNRLRRHFTIPVPIGKEAQVIAHFRALNQLFPTTSIAGVSEKFVFTFTDDLFANKALDIFLPSNEYQRQPSGSAFFDKVARARLLLQDAIAFESALPKDPRFWQGGLLDLHYYPFYLSRASSSERANLEVMVRLIAKAALMIKPTIDLENSLQAQDGVLMRCLAEVAPVEYQKINERVAFLGDLVNFQIR